jgi:hypothetical protein
MIERRTHSLLRSQKKRFFPPSDTLSSQFVKDAQDHAIYIVSSWARLVYSRHLKPVIAKLRSEGALSELEAKALYTIGFRLIGKPWKFITQDHIDTYFDLLGLHAKNPPRIPDSIGMRLSEFTSRIEISKKSRTFKLWIRVSSLEYRKSIWLPIVGNPLVEFDSILSKGILARKDTLGRWRFEVVDKKKWEPPKVSENAGKIGIDVGLNVLATTSQGDVYGADVKPKFDKLYAKIRRVRANRQRQGLKHNSRRLDRLESRLSGLVKTETGRISNKLVQKHPDTIFIVEDLNLSGCRGQKRFAYRALQQSLERKAVTEKVNPAYTSQECPSCGHVERGNRSGVRFKCRVCGRKAHADWVGARNILRRSEVKDISCGDHPKSVKQKLRARWMLCRNRHSGDSVLSSGSDP